MQVILASTSTRRKELLELLEIPFSIAEPDSEEDGQENQSARELVQQLALEKAQSVATRFPEAIVLGGDTLVEIYGTILGKPVNLKDAERMLRQISGRTHQVHSGIALVSLKTNRQVTDVETTQVRFKKLSESEIQSYLETGESLGKAGAYCIQDKGAVLIESISGDYPTVVGLPLKKVAMYLEREGIVLPQKVQEIYQRRSYPNWDKFNGL